MEKLIFPLYTLPPLSYMKVLLNCNTAYISLGEPFKKQTFRSRFEIMSPNKRQLLSIPLAKGKTKISLENVQISYAEPWQKKHWHAIETAYDNSPFFMYLDYKLKPSFIDKPTFLWEYNFQLLQNILGILNADVKLELTTELPNTTKQIEDQATPVYPQVFAHKHPFMENLSILDWLFNMGVD